MCNSASHLESGIDSMGSKLIKIEFTRWDLHVEIYSLRFTRWDSLVGIHSLGYTRGDSFVRITRWDWRWDSLMEMEFKHSQTTPAVLNYSLPRNREFRRGQKQLPKRFSPDFQQLKTDLYLLIVRSSRRSLILRINKSVNPYLSTVRGSVGP